MKGVIKNVIASKRFGFILGTNGGEYFFHKDDFSGHWDDLVDDSDNHIEILVEFNVVESPNGPRAADVKRTDFPNES